MIKQYSKYKDIDFVWLKKAPSNWDVCRLKDIVKTASGTTPKSSNLNYYNDGIHNWVRTTDLNNDILNATEYKITDLAVEECNLKFFPVETLLLAMYGGAGTIGKNALLNKESTINQSVCALLPNPKKYSSKFLFYFLKYFRKDWMIFALGTRKDPNINQDAVKNLSLCLPPIQEQIQIADYLEKKTTAIDRKITLLEQKTEHYLTLRKSLINETVTKGLDKNVKLKDSGIEWIGQIPKHWDLLRGKEIFKENLKSKISAKQGNVKGKYKFFTSSNKQTKWLDDYMIDKPSLMFNTGGISGVNYCDSKYSYSTDSWSIYTNRYSLKYYYYYYTSILYVINEKGFRGTGIKHLQKDFIKQELTPVFDNNEQMEIVEFLDKKSKIVDNIIKNIKDQITILRELRETLISDVVTGKIKVTT